MICSILACTSQGALGNRGTLPWPKHKEDMAHFKKMTTGNVVVMGRNTWDDPLMPKPLPDRISYVISNQSLNSVYAQRISGDLGNELKQLQINWPHKDVFVIGGKQIYEATAPYVDRVYLTRMKGAWWADTRINLERYLLGFRLKSVWPGDNCTFEIWDRELFFG